MAQVKRNMSRRLSFASAAESPLGKKTGHLDAHVFPAIVVNHPGVNNVSSNQSGIDN